jgi:MbtH protein
MMTDGDEPDMRPYYVVVNDEEQYSIWSAALTVPDGWTTVGAAGQKAECLVRIAQLWTDMRPRSLRDSMAADASETSP